MRASILGVLIASACGAHQHGGDPACNAHWEIDRFEQRDPLTSTWDVALVDPGPIWTGDLNGDGVKDFILRYRGSRTHEAVVLRGCGDGSYEVLLDEVRASQVGTSPGAGGWLDLVLVDGKHRAEFHHGAHGYDGPPETLGEEPDWQ